MSGFLRTLLEQNDSTLSGRLVARRIRLQRDLVKRKRWRTNFRVADHREVGWATQYKRVYQAAQLECKNSYKDEREKPIQNAPIRLEVCTCAGLFCITGSASLGTSKLYRFLGPHKTLRPYVARVSFLRCPNRSRPDSNRNVPLGSLAIPSSISAGGQAHRSRHNFFGFHQLH